MGRKIVQNMPRKKTNEEFINELRTIHPKIEVLDYYINSDTKIKVKCLETSKKKMFIQGKEYKGVIWGNTHYRLIGEDGKK